MKEIIELSTKTISVKRNEFIKISGTVDTNIYYIVNGSVKLFILEGDQEQIIRFGYKGNIIVALDAFISGKPSNLYIQAIKKSTIKVITKAQLYHFLQTNQQHQLWIHILEDLVLQQLEREVDILTSSPKERYRRVKERSPQLFQEIPNRYIANYLRMSAETLSRLKKS
jgi:CRP-like cAMP-binding protein